MSTRPRLALASAGLLLATFIAQPPFAAAAPNRLQSMQPTGTACQLVTSLDLAAVNVDAAHGELSTTPSAEGATSGCLITAVNPNSTSSQPGQREILLRLFRAAIASEVAAD